MTLSGEGGGGGKRFRLRHQRGREHERPGIGEIERSDHEAKAIRYLQVVSRDIGRFFENYDALLTPVLNQPPVKIGALKLSAAEQNQIKLIGRTGATWILEAMGVIKPVAARTYEFIPWTPVQRHGSACDVGAVALER